MKYAVGFLILAFMIGAVSVSARSKQHLCRTGQIRGFALVQGDPRLGGIGALPGSRFAGSQQWFRIRYNCTGRNVLARRVDEGVYDVMFPGNPGRVAVVSAFNQQAASASVQYVDDFTFRVSIRGPVTDNNILIRREIPFYIAIF